MASGSSPVVALTGASVLGHIPATLRGELLHALNEVLRNYREGRWEPSASMVTSKPANEGHLKTGQRRASETGLF